VRNVLIDTCFNGRKTLVTYIEKYSKKVLMEPISTSSGTSSKEDIEASVNKYIPHKGRH
jgi:hypothetical protein